MNDRPELDTSDSARFETQSASTMSSPPREAVMSSSPVIGRGGSPTRRKDSLHDGDSSRPRMSPTLARSYDPNDPQVRERQRTMDVDMAMHLSRARRETATNASPASSFDSPRQEDEPPFNPLNALSPHEQHDLDIACGHTSHFDGGIDDGDSESIIPRRDSPLLDLRTHIQHTQDPSLLVSSNNHVAKDHSSPALGGLPMYQANVSAPSFDFMPMEEFAAEEKATLGISSPQHRFASPAAQASTSQVGLDSAGQPDDNGTETPRPRTPRQRRLSQSISQPRSHRKGIGGKLALFEGHSGEPPLSLPGKLGIPVANERPNRISFLDEPLGPSTSAPGGFSGIVGPGSGHDRPYRFSFYSNTLPSTIHARSLSELPAEGQSFADLFTGITIPDAVPYTNAPVLDGNGKRSSTSKPPGSYFPKPPQADKPGHMSGGMLGGGYHDGTTWWLDIQNPTDEEMKMLSKVFDIHPLTTEDIQMEETREKIELFRNYYLVCFRSFDQDPYSPTHLEPLNMYIIVFREGILSVRRLRNHFFSIIHSCIVSLPANTSSSERPSPYQAVEGLHKRDFGLDIICSH